MNDPILKFVSQAPSKRLIDQSLLQIVTLIQAQIRSFLQRKRYAKRKRSLLMIQKFARQYKTKRLFKKIVHSVTFIQAMYRGYLARKAAKREADLIEKAVYKSVKVW